jgi:hypothetical protein
MLIMGWRRLFLARHPLRGVTNDTATGRRSPGGRIV